jgi:hypothetical protein
MRDIMIARASSPELPMVYFSDMKEAVATLNHLHTMFNTKFVITRISNNEV